MSAIELDHVTKVFPTQVRALNDVSLTVADGELLVLVGPSGCGKTTALRVIAGLERPSQGRVRIAGRDVTDLSPRLRDVAMVFQKSTLYPHLTVRENLAFGLRLREGAGWWSDQRKRLRMVRTERVAEAARVLQIDSLLNRLPAQLSGGQQQRVALGRALVRQPRVLLLDEPLSHLDFRLRAELRRELHLLHQRLRGTMLYVTHDPTEALALGDRIALLDSGRLLQCAEPATVYARPASRRVAEFFGWPPMNFVEGQLREINGQAIFQGLGGQIALPGPGLSLASGRLVTLGIRPEHVSLRPPERTIEATITSRLKVVAVEGHEGRKVVTLCCGNALLAALTDGDVAIGQELDVMIDTKHTHWFDSNTGLALAHGVQTG